MHNNEGTIVGITLEIRSKLNKVVSCKIVVIKQ